MPVFHNVDGKLKKLGLLPLEKEKALQKLIEENLLEVLDLRFLVSEYSTTHGGRIDTLAIDSTEAPVIIEYKRNVNDQIIPQALFYLTWLKSQSVDFFKGLTREKLASEKAIEINWHNPRVICIAESYNKFDIVGFKEVPGLELYRYHFYEDNVFVLDKVNSEVEKHSAAQFIYSDKIINKYQTKTLLTDSVKIIEDLKKDINFNLENQLKKSEQNIKDLYKDLEGKIFQLDENIYRKDNPQNIAFRVSKAFAEVHMRKDHILIYLRPVEYDDPAKMVFPVPETHGWPLKRGVRIKNENDLTYIMPFIEQSYKDVL